MALDIIKAIKKAEEEAEKILEDSISLSRDIVSNGEKEKQRLLLDLAKEGEEKSKKIIEDMEILARKEVEGIYAKARKEGETIKQRTDHKIEDAINLVIEKVVKSHGNS